MPLRVVPAGLSRHSLYGKQVLRPPLNNLRDRQRRNQLSDRHRSRDAAVLSLYYIYA